jgi:hypothetical protein
VWYGTTDDSGAAADDFAGEKGVFRFDQLYDFHALHIKPKAVSDHYPIWAKFYTNKDRD